MLAFSSKFSETGSQNEQEDEQGFGNLILERTCHDFGCTLFIGNKSVGTAHTQGKEIHKDMKAKKQRLLMVILEAVYQSLWSVLPWLTGQSSLGELDFNRGQGHCQLKMPSDFRAIKMCDVIITL